MIDLILYLGVFLLTLLSIAGVAMFVSSASRWPGHVFSSLMLLILVATVSKIILSGRVLVLNEWGYLDNFVQAGSDSLLAKVLLTVVIVSSVAMCLAWPVNLRSRNRVISRFAERGLKAPTDIVIAFMVYFVAFSILPIFFGQKYYFHVSLIYPFFVFLALLLWIQLSDVDPVITSKQCLSLIVFGSLAAAVVAPNIAIQPGYGGLIPGFDIRLWGITHGPNTLGSAAAILLVLEAAEPARKNWLKMSNWGGAGLALILTQSKTSILAAIVGIFIIFSWRLLTDVFSKDGIHRKNGTLASMALIAFVAVTTAMLGAWIMFSDTSILAGLEKSLNTRAVDDIATATGRLWIWENAIKGGFDNPLFGQGGGFWSEENAHRTGLLAAVHAHNLFLQAFSQSGIVGLGALLIFLWFLARYALRAAKGTGGGSLALMIVFLMRAMFEVPLEPNAILGAEFFSTVALFFYLIDRGAKPIQSTPKSKSNSIHVFK